MEGFFLHPRPKTVLARILIFLIEVFGPILRLVGFIVRAIYGAFFSWWLNPALDRRAEKSFADEIKQAAPFLFDQYEEKAVSEPRPTTRDAWQQRPQRLYCVRKSFLEILPMADGKLQCAGIPHFCTE
jgi:hypothetical protein